MMVTATRTGVPPRRMMSDEPVREEPEPSPPPPPPPGDEPVPVQTPPKEAHGVHDPHHARHRRQRAKA
jgi:hypothetical protein